jgi:5-methylthioadenosine/S-adenosylhomocysteine deaminase
VTHVDTLITNARFVLACDDQRTTFEHAGVAIEYGRIVAVGDITDFTANHTIDASGCIVLPGLINLHTHLPMTLLRGIAENVDLQGFLERVWAEEARIMGPEGTYLGARLGALEALLGGTTTALDMYFHPEAAHRGAVEVGMRHAIGPVFFDFPGPDGLEWSERIELTRSWPGTLEQIGGPYVPRYLMPHSPLIVNPEHLEQINELAREIDARVNTHTSENDKENADTIAAHGDRPTALLLKAGLLDERITLAHCVRLNDDDRAAIASTGGSVAHNPGSNLKLASGAMDLVGYRDQGITVGLGTDGCSSSNDLDMFAVLRLAANLARLVHHDPAAISAEDIVRAATIDGARALGMADRIGSIEVGKEADLIIVDTAVPHLTPLHDPFTALVYAAGRSDVRDVFVAGEQVIANRQPTKVELFEVMEAARAHVEDHHVKGQS